MAKKRHHWIVRVTHWVNFVAIVIMVGSGLEIFNAYPAFASGRGRVSTGSRSAVFSRI